MDPETPNCPTCGADLPDGPPCPVCTLTAAADGAPPPEAPFDAAALDAVLLGYDVEEHIGRGGMADVFRARDRRLGRTVAIKVLRPAGLDDSRVRAHIEERFEREARALARLDHPNVVRIHDFGHVGGDAPFLYLVLEYVDGVTLREAIRRGDVTPDDARDVVEELAGALAAAHDLGIVHRDVKPENVLVDGDGRLRLADFGLAKLRGDGAGDVPLTQTGEGLGTPHYMAPEQLDGGEVGPEADVYALAVVVYELLTGRLPVGHFAPASGGRRLFRRVDDVLLDGLAQDPGERTASAAEFAEEFDRAWPRGASAGMPGDDDDPRDGALRARELGTWYMALGMLATLTQSWVLVEPQKIVHQPLGEGPGFVAQELQQFLVDTGTRYAVDGLDGSSTVDGILSVKWWSAGLLFALAACLRTAQRFEPRIDDRIATALVVLGALPVLLLPLVTTQVLGGSGLDIDLMVGGWLAILVTAWALLREYAVRTEGLPTLDDLPTLAELPRRPNTARLADLHPPRPESAKRIRNKARLRMRQRKRARQRS